jgi:hypothetical protein
LVENDGAMLLGWKDRNLISASAWHWYRRRWRLDMLYSCINYMYFS